MWVLVLTRTSPCDANFAAGGFHLYETHFLLTTHTNFSVLNFKLGVQANYPLARVFFFHTLATAFPTFYHVKTACSC